MSLTVYSSLTGSLSEVAAMTAHDLPVIASIEFDDSFVASWAEPGREVMVWEMKGECVTCACREVVLDLVDRGAQAVILPPGIELLHLCPGLAGELGERGERLGVVSVVDVDRAREDLLGDETCLERGIGIGDGDERTLADVLSLNMGYADYVVCVGADHGGRELVTHLGAPEVVRIDDDRPVGFHDPEAAIARVHPATCTARGGASLHGTWTINLYSDRPFHPERLRELVTEIGQSGLIVRGCFWIPSRPGTVCSFESVGGAVSVGDCGLWDGQAPHCHVSVTGVGRPERGDVITRAFHEIVCRDDESWILADDLADWLG